MNMLPSVPSACIQTILAPLRTHIINNYIKSIKVSIKTDFLDFCERIKVSVFIFMTVLLIRLYGFLVFIFDSFLFGIIVILSCIPIVFWVLFEAWWSASKHKNTKVYLYIYYFFGEQNYNDLKMVLLLLLFPLRMTRKKSLIKNCSEENVVIQSIEKIL